MKINKTKLNVLLAQRDLNKQGLADRMGVSHGAVSQYLHHNVRLGTLANIARALDVGIEDIIQADVA